MTASSKIPNICLSQLVLSPANVRKTAATAAEDMALESRTCGVTAWSPSPITKPPVS